MSLDPEKEFTRQLALAMFPEGCGIDPTDLEIVLPNCGEGCVKIKVEGYLEAKLAERLAKVLKAGQEALKLVALDVCHPMSTIPETDFQGRKRVMLYMGGQWVEGGINHTLREDRKGKYSSVYAPGRTMEWDEANQPTAWKPL